MQRQSTTMSHDLNFFWPHKTKTISVRRLSTEMLFPCVLTLTKESPWERSHSMCLGNLIMHTDRLLCTRTHTFSLTLSTPFLAGLQKGHINADKASWGEDWRAPTNLLKAFLSRIQPVSNSKKQSRKAPTWQLTKDWERGEWLH